MNRGVWSFKPRLIPSLAALAAVCVLTALGMWQLHRGAQKQLLFDQIQSRGQLPVLDIKDTSDLDAHSMIGRKVRIVGNYHERWRILLDNQIHQGQPGYHVHTPLYIGDQGRWLLINRGWIPAGAYRDRVPLIETPAGKITITGRVQEPPFTGILLSAHFIEALTDTVLRTQSLRLDALGERTGLNFRAFIIRLDPESPTGFVRDYPRPNAGAERHRGYACQWFAMAAMTIILFLYYSVKRAG